MICTILTGAADDILALAAQVCEVPVAAISLVDQDRLWLKSLLGLSLRQLERAGSFCDIAVHGTGLLIVSDVRADARFAACSLLAGAQPSVFMPVLRCWTGRAWRWAHCA